MNPTPSELWHQAGIEWEGDPEARRQRYRELMTEHGYLLKPGDDGYDANPNLDCGWPANRQQVVEEP